MRRHVREFKHRFVVLLICLMFTGSGGPGLWAGIGGKGKDTTTTRDLGTTSITINNIPTQAGTVTATGSVSGEITGSATQSWVVSLLGLAAGTSQAAEHLAAYIAATERQPSSQELVTATALIQGALSYQGGDLIALADAAPTVAYNLSNSFGGRTSSESSSFSSASIVVGTASLSRSASYTTTTSVRTASGLGITTNTTTTTASVLLGASGTGTAYVATHDRYISPLVLDMDGDGVLEASGGKWLPHPQSLTARYLDTERLVLFDIYGNGMEELVEWVGPHDGLLVEPKPDGTVDGNSLFGTVGGFANGYEKLSFRDRNRDGRLTGAELNGLSVWQDVNGNGKVDAAEMTSVQLLGITEIRVTASDKMVSSFMRNGQTYTMWDWYPNVVQVKKMKVEEVRRILGAK